LYRDWGKGVCAKIKYHQQLSVISYQFHPPGETPHQEQGVTAAGTVDCFRDFQIKKYPIFSCGMGF
jgi:hypothetical protein